MHVPVYNYLFMDFKFEIYANFQCCQIKWMEWGMYNTLNKFNIRKRLSTITIANVYTPRIYLVINNTLFH